MKVYLDTWPNRVPVQYNIHIYHFTSYSPATWSKFLQSMLKKSYPFKLVITKVIPTYLLHIPPPSNTENKLLKLGFTPTWYFLDIYSTLFDMNLLLSIFSATKIILFQLIRITINYKFFPSNIQVKTQDFSLSWNNLRLIDTLGGHNN